MPKFKQERLSVYIESIVELILSLLFVIGAVSNIIGN